MVMIQHYYQQHPHCVIIAQKCIRPRTICERRRCCASSTYHIKFKGSLHTTRNMGMKTTTSQKPDDIGIKPRIFVCLPQPLSRVNINADKQLKFIHIIHVWLSAPRLHDSADRQDTTLSSYKSRQMNSETCGTCSLMYVRCNVNSHGCQQHLTYVAD